MQKDSLESLSPAVMYPTVTEMGTTDPYSVTSHRDTAGASTNTDRKPLTLESEANQTVCLQVRSPKLG